METTLLEDLLRLNYCSPHLFNVGWYRFIDSNKSVSTNFLLILLIAPYERKYCVLRFIRIHIFFRKHIQACTHGCLCASLRGIDNINYFLQTFKMYDIMLLSLCTFACVVLRETTWVMRKSQADIQSVAITRTDCLQRPFLKKNKKKHNTWWHKDTVKYGMVVIPPVCAANTNQHIVKFWAQPSSLQPREIYRNKIFSTHSLVTLFSQTIAICVFVQGFIKYTKILWMIPWLWSLVTLSLVLRLTVIHMVMREDVSAAICLLFFAIESTGAAS